MVLAVEAVLVGMLFCGMLLLMLPAFWWSAGRRMVFAIDGWPLLAVDLALVDCEAGMAIESRSVLLAQAALAVCQLATPLLTCVA